MSASATPVRRNRVVVALLLAWLVAYFVIRLFLERDETLADPVRLSLAFVPTPLFAAFLWQFVQALRGADELERRIQLEALAIAFPLGLLLLTTLGLAQRAVMLRFEDWSFNHVWPMFAFFYVAGLAAARRRYS